MGLATSSRVHKRITTALVDTYREELIKWPTRQTLQKVIQQFEDLQGFPGMVGAIDGSHIPITAPAENSNDYINRKKFHSVILQPVCDAELLITDAFCGYPGRVHDARVLRNSPLYQDAMNNKDLYFPGNTHLVGDSAYPLVPWLITPFRHYGRFTCQERKYNYKQSSTRMAIEHVFGVLKARFKRLQLRLDIPNTEEVPITVIAACILHNLAILHHEDLDDFMQPDPHNVNYQAQNVFPPNLTAN